MTFSLTPIGVIHSPYKEKFAIPRQPGLVRSARATLELQHPFNQLDALRGIEEFSHLWITFIFHETLAQGWNPTVRPPRLGGNERVGLFASRSPFRPNGLGLSVVELHGVRHQNGRVWLELGAIDLLDGTPVVDIKPYVPYADALPEARGGFAPDAPQAPLKVEFSVEAEAKLLKQEPFRTFIGEVLAQDPRPAYKRGKPDEKIYGVRLGGYNVRFAINEPLCTVLALEEINDESTADH